MDSRVRDLTLRVRTSPERWAEIRPRAEAFASRVLARAADLLESRAPGRVLLLRTLDMKWRLLDDAMGLDTEVDAFAERIAASLDERARAAPRTPGATDELAVFEDEVQWRAAHLQALAGRSGLPWFFSRLAGESDSLGGLTRRDNAALAIAVMTTLAQAGALAEVLHRLPGAVVEGLCDVVEGGRGPSMTVTGVGVEPRPASDQLGEASRHAGEKRRRAIARLLALANDQASYRVSEMPKGESPRPHGADEPSDHEPPIAPAEIDETTLHEKSHHEKSQSTEMDASKNLAPVEWSTRWGGLFYLLNPALELGVGEILWKACLDERAFLAAVAFHCLGGAETDDPAPALFAGAPVPAQLPPCEPDLQREVATSLFSAIVQALPRRGLADLPSLTMALVGKNDEHRILVASPRGTEFVLFAAAANSSIEVTDAVERLLAHWPASAEAPRASPALAQLDRRGRVVAERGLTTQAWFPGRTASAMVVAQLVGVLSHLFLARARVTHADARRRLAEDHLALPGRIRATDERMTVELPLEQVNLGVRLGGLDRDPGWVPWLGKRVELAYVSEQ